MPADTAARMRAYWDERARRNAAWYVDTSLDYADPDMPRFFATGEKVVAEALDGAPVRPAGHRLAVEIGCGLGRICRALAPRFDDVLGLDIAPEMLARARELVAEPRVRFAACSGAGLEPVADASVDFVLSFTVFQHIPDPQVIAAYVREMGRVLAPGGVAAFQWNGGAHPRLWAWRRSLALLRGRLARDDRLGTVDRAFLGSVVPVPLMRRWLAEAGLELVAARGEGSLWTWAWARRPG